MNTIPVEAVQGPANVATPPALAMRQITKRYDRLVANDRVDFDVRGGEIHVLLGENGAGKTTLMSIAFGLVQPDEGEIVLDGEPVIYQSPRDALARGVGMVHQHFMLIPDFTVAESVVLGSESVARARIRRDEIETQVADVAERFGMSDLDPGARIRDLPIETRQRVEILKLLYRDARVLILDEPTSILGPAQVEVLFATLKKLRQMGRSTVIVTHKLAEVVAIADRVTVLKQGRNSITVESGSFDERTLAKEMTGRDVEHVSSPPFEAGSEVRQLLEVRGLKVRDRRDHLTLEGIDLSLRSGEILGIAGVEGNGQGELVRVLAGVLEPESGTVVVDGQEVTKHSPEVMHRAGVAVVPEDRHAAGLVLDMTVAENLALESVPAGGFSRWGLLRRRAMRAHAERILEEFDVRPRDPNVPASALSGGNQQKLVLARELEREPTVMVAAQPTQGLDVGAAEAVHRLLVGVAEAGRCVLLVSHDLEELMKLTHRLIVLYRGKVVLEGDTSKLTIDDLAMAMAGSQAVRPADA